MHVAHEPEDTTHIPELKKFFATVQTEKNIFKGHNRVLQDSV